MNRGPDGDAGRRALARLFATAIALLILCSACSSLPPAPRETPSPSVPPVPTPLPSLTPFPTPAAGLYVDASRDLGAISPFVFGTNYGPLLFVPLQMQPAAGEARLTVLRYPGGNWGDNNDIDLWNLDQFVAFAHQIGAEPYLCVRLKGGTAHKAAELVRYANVERGYDIRFWSIGNEPNLYDDYSVEQFNDDWRAWATAMRAVDPTILLLGPEVNQFYANPSNDMEREQARWMTEFLRLNGDIVNVVSFHRYPFPRAFNGDPPTIAELRADSPRWEGLIADLRSLVRAHAGRDLPIAVTEANSSWVPFSGGEAGLDTHYNAIWWGDSLGRMIRQGVFMVNQFGITSEWGLMSNYEVRPIYYVYAMYREFGAERVAASSDDPDISVFGARRADGALTVMVVHRGSAAVDRPLTLAGLEPPLSAETWLFDADHPAEPIDPKVLGPSTNIHIPPESMMLFVIR
jgi:hypothetical protein